MKEIKLSAAIELFSNFKSLNGKEKAVKNKGQESIILEPYNFDGKTIWNISKNLNTLKSHIQLFEENQEILIAGTKTDEFMALSVEEKQKRVSVINDKLKEMLESKVSIDGLLKVEYKGLNLGFEAGQNSIPAGTIASLTEWIVGEPV